MKKLVVNLELCLILIVFFALNTKAQTNCHALFSSQQKANSLDVDFIDLSTSQSTITSWVWDFGDGSSSTLQNPSHTYIHAGTYTVCLAIHDVHGCSDHICQHVTLNAITNTDCIALFNFQQISNTLNINFINSSKSPNNITSWSWDFGDGNVSSLKDPSHTYTHAGTYTACLTIHDDHGCSDHYCHHIVVVSTTQFCHAAFTFSYDTASNIFTFENSSTGTTNQTSYLWDFGNGVNSTEENPQYMYTHLGSYLVCLNIHDGSTGCSSHFCHDVNYQHVKHHFHTIEVQSSFESPSYSQSQISKGDVTNSVVLKAFISNSNIQFEILKDGFVDIGIYSLNGCKIKSVSNEFLSKGIYKREIETDLITNGLYVMKIIIANESFSRIFSVLK